MKRVTKPAADPIPAAPVKVNPCPDHPELSPWGCWVGHCEVCTAKIHIPARGNRPSCCGATCRKVKQRNGHRLF